MTIITIAKKYAIFGIVALIYYLSPLLLIQDTGSAIFILLIILPLFVFIVSEIYTVKNGFKWYFPIVVGLLWIPNIFLLNDSAAFYIVFYGIISLIGQIIGIVIKIFK
ncbi:hypothetical protein [Streptococcus zalophi]|uniref:hypothetical protein n=1 Tax=Streptococcus zalophi TaxID=640031 RepID=UPI00215C85E1|nr:hypothetical protein [Streptococcus zalophi]MCR8967053.1 hypothetical protein [Streptococcus zalophi]